MAKNTNIKEVVICEPQCWGLMHVPFNSALISTLLFNKYPEYKIYFLAEKSHIHEVKKFLNKEINKDTIIWKKIDIPDRSLKNWYRIIPVLKLFKNLLSHIRKNKIDCIIFSSISNVELLTAKIFCYLLKDPIKIFVIPHGVLHSIAEKQSLMLFNRFISFRSVFRYPESKYFAYIILGNSIFKYLQSNINTTKKNIFILDHPYLWKSFAENHTDQKKDSKVRFGFFGVGSKGFDTFYRLALDITKKHKNVEFVLVGFLNKKNGRIYKDEVVKGISYSRISQHEYLSKAEKLTYTVWVGSPEKYKLTASGSFLDAISFIKPTIYQKNPYIDYCTRQMGNIGYECSDIKEIYDTIISILERFPEEEYNMQCKNILNGRKVFEPRTLSPQLREIMEY